MDKKREDFINSILRMVHPEQRKDFETVKRSFDESCWNQFKITKEEYEIWKHVIIN